MSDRSGDKHKVGGNTGEARRQKQAKADAAAERQIARDLLTNAEQLRKLDDRGMDAVRERRRLV